MKNLTPSWTRITEKRGDNLKKAELNALAVRARDGNEETLLDLWNAVKGFVKKKAVYYAKNHTAGMTTAEDLVQAGFFAVYDTVQAFDETREIFPDPAEILPAKALCRRSRGVHQPPGPSGGQPPQNRFKGCNPASLKIHLNRKGE